MNEPVRAENLASGYKADEKKQRMDLIPPDVMLDLGALYAMGSQKYADRNWEKGMKWGRVYAALLRHLFKWWNGEENDPDGQHHLDSVIWSAIALKHYVNQKERYAAYDYRSKG